MRSFRHPLGTLVAVLLAAGAVTAQEKVESTFWVDDNTPASKMLKRVRDLEAGGDAVGAMQAYQGLLEKPSTAGVFPLVPGEEGSPYALYVGVREACRQALSGLDPDRLAQYRASHDGNALKLLHEGLTKRDLAALRAAASTYGATSYADDILLAIAELSIEQGDLQGATAALAPIVRSPASYAVTLPQLRLALFRYAWCQRQLGRRDRLAALHRAATGAEALLVAFSGLLGLAGRPLDAVLLRHRAVFDVPVAADGARVTLRQAVSRLAALRGSSTTPLEGLGRKAAWSVSLPPVPMLPPMGDPQRIILAMGQAAVSLRMVLWDPSIEAGFSPASGAASSPPWLFVHTGAEGLVLDARSGQEAPWKWSTGDLLAPDDAVGKGRLPRRACVRGDRMYASLESGWCDNDVDENGDEQATSQILRCSLYAFDLSREGYRLWDTERPRGTSADVEFLSKTTTLSPPATDGATVYAGAAKLETDVRLFVTALDARTGELKWKTELGAAVTNSMRWQRADTAQRVFPGLAPVLADGLVIYCSNWGVVAALDAGNGEVKWLVQYGRKRSVQTRGEQPDWAENGVEVAFGQVVAAPQDSDCLFCFDLANGRMIGKPFPRVTDKMQYRYVAVLPEGRIALLSDKAAYVGSLDNPSHKLARVELQEPAIGRPLLDGEDLLVPGAKALYRVRIRAEKLEEFLRWPEKAAGGIELARIEGGLVALTRERVYGYR